MGIINITEDSFYRDSRAFSNDRFLSQLAKHMEEGADIIDIGACSTRPGSTPVSAEEEWKRLEPKLKIFRQLFPFIPLSIDTFRAPIVQKCFEEIGPFMVNDISAGEDDSRMLPLVGSLNLAYIAMHKRGNPNTMQSLCEYENGVVHELLHYFREFDQKAKDNGVDHWILDPGFGFAKTIEQNYELLDHLNEFKILGHEILVGISRKSFIYKPLGITPSEALPATTALHQKAIENGADILRVHDVAAAKKLLHL